MIPRVERAVEQRSPVAALRRLRAGRELPALGAVVRHWPAVLAIGAVALVAWPFASIVPGVDEDWNWHAALAFAAEHGLRFGDRLVWTYGPLGFLIHGPLLYYGDVAIVQMAFAWLVQLLLAGTLFLLLRRSFPALVAFAAAAVVVALVDDRLSALAIAWCALLLARREGAPRDAVAAAFAPAAGVLAGVAALGKLNQGVGIVLIVLVTLVAFPGRRRRDLATFALVALATAAIGWVATGQTLADVWPYLRNGKEIVSGYPAAMGMPHPELPWAPWSAAVVAALSLVLLLDVARDALPRRRTGLLAVWAIFLFLAWKQGFVRHGGILYFADVLVLFAVLPVRRDRRAFALGALAAAVVIALASYGASDLGQRLDPIGNAKAAVHELRTLASRDRRGAVKADLRQRIVTHYGLPAAFVQAIGRQTVAFWAYSYADLVYAYDLDWRPPPVLEPYSAYTPALDRLDADLLASARAPRWIVRSTLGGLDNRFVTFEVPLATLQIVCRYRPVGVSPPWELLVRTADRCGAPRVVATVSARWGQSVPVPPAPPGALLLVRIDGANPQGIEQLRAALLRPYERSVALDGRPYRLIAATAADGLLLRAPANADHPAPFTMAPNPGQISVSREGGSPGESLRYTFVAVPVRPLPRSAAR